MQDDVDDEQVAVLAHDTLNAPTMKHPRRFGQLPNLAVSDNVDDPSTQFPSAPPPP
jgi:hypothetical protein